MEKINYRLGILRLTMRYRALITTVLAMVLALTVWGGAATADNSLTYDQIRGTGLANNCPTVDQFSRQAITIDPNKSYRLTALCLQPTSFFVKEEANRKRQSPEFLPSKLMTRFTSSIDAVEGTLTNNNDGSLTFTEKDGIDFQAVTVKLPGGELVPLLFTVKNLVATSDPSLTAITTSTDFSGHFTVPSYRTSAFLDPKGRGLTAGYDNAVALPAQADDSELIKENVKRFDVGAGSITLQVARVNSSTGEIAGTFESLQPSDTDMGSKQPREVKIQGLFYGRVEAA